MRKMFMLTHRNNTTRVTKLIIKRRKDDTIRKIDLVERRDTRWFPPIYTYDELYEPKKMKI